MYIYKSDINSHKIIYIPVLMNIRSVASNSSGISRGYYKECEYLRGQDFLPLLAEEIDNFDDNCYCFIDFWGIIHADGGYEVFSNLITRKHIVFYNLESIPFGKIRDDLQDYIDNNTLVSRDGIIASENDFNFFEQNRDSIGGIATRKIREFILNENSDPKKTFSRSSNVWMSRYIDIKRTFDDPSVFQLIIFELGKYILEKYKNMRTNHKLICASQNGAAIAAALGIFLNMDVDYLMNIGPKLSIRDKSLIRGLKSESQYVFIADMICLGSEYKIVKTLLALTDCVVVDGMTVAKYLDYDDDNKLFTICEINDGDEFEYEVTVSKKDNEKRVVATTKSL